MSVYEGVIAEIPVGHRGATANRNQAALAHDDLIAAEGVTFEDRTVQKEPGAALLLQAIAGAPIVTGVHDWRPDAATQRLVTFANGTLWKDDGVKPDGTSLATGLAATARPWFVEMGQEDVGLARKLMVYTGSDLPRILAGDGLTAPALAAAKAPTDWTGTNQPVAGIMHRKSIISYGNPNDASRFYRTLTTDHEDYRTIVYDETVEPSVGLRLMGAASFQGPLWLFKYPEGIFFLDDADPDTGNWAIRTKSTALGIVESPYAVLPLDDDVLFVTPDGSIHLLSAVTALGGTKDSDLSAALAITPWIRDNVNLSRLNQVTSVWDSAKKQARLGLPRAGSTVNDATLIFDFAEGLRAVKFSWSFRDSVEALALRQTTTTKVKRPIAAGAAGKVYALDQATRSKDGVGYPSTWQTAHTDFRHLSARYASTRKKFEFLAIVMHPQGTWNLSVDVVIDGAFSETLTFSMGQGGSALDSFVLDTSALGGDAVSVQRKRLHGSGTRLSLVPRLNGAGQNFSVAKFLVYFQPLSEDTR